MSIKRSRSRKRTDDGRAFFQDFSNGYLNVPDDLAESFAEDFLLSATSGQEQSERFHELVVDEDSGGPFIISSRRKELSRRHPGYEGGDLEAFPSPGPAAYDPINDLGDEPGEYRVLDQPRRLGRRRSNAKDARKRSTRHRTDR